MANKYKNKNVKDIAFNSNKIYFEFIRDIATDSSSYGVDNTMVIFKSNDDILYFIYAKKNSIISYDLINNQKINEIKDYNNSYVTNLKHYFHKNKRQDLIISASVYKYLKLWKLNKWECLLNIETINVASDLGIACFLNLNNQIYIVTSNLYNFGPIKVFNLKGIAIKEINNYQDKVECIDIYYDNKTSQPYIITGNSGFVKSFDYNKSKVYHTYNDNGEDYIKYNKIHFSFKIKNENNLIKLIESCVDGKIRIWNFHTGELLNRIYISDEELYGICLWNDDYLFIGCSDNTIKILDIKKSKVIGNINGHKKYVLVLAKVNTPKYGEYLISQEMNVSKLWKIKMNN